MAFSEEQRRNAQAIIGVGRSLGMGDRDILIGLMTAMQESSLRNLNYGDRDSLGLFQQRPSQGWGTRAQVTDPTYAATKFFNTLKGVGGRDGMSLTQAAQKVQRSAFPNAYAKHEAGARQLLSELAGGAPAGGAPAAPGVPSAQAQAQDVLASSQPLDDPAAAPTRALGIDAPTAVGTQGADRPMAFPDIPETSVVPAASGDDGSDFLPQMDRTTFTPIAGGGASGRAGELVNKAKQFLGTPYVWGGTQPGGFDCSGFLQYVYRQMGINLPRISADQARAGKRIGLDQLKPGDMVAWDNSSRNNGADHIAMYIGNGQVIHAPRPGDKVKISQLWDQGRAWGVSMGL